MEKNIEMIRKVRSNLMMANIQSYLSEKRETHLEELKELLRIPSISALSEHKGDIKAAADWVANALMKAGLENVEIIPTNGHPIIYADWLHAPGKPTALIYGHYDVQPVDPLHLWTTPPFEPDIRDEKLYARGATDDKGQFYMHVKVVEAILQTTGTLPVNIKFCIEGEEEIGSPHLPLFLEEQTDKLKSDVVVISDSSLFERGKPCILYGLRGLCALQLDVKGAKGDLHSGVYGGGVPNSIHALVEILASMHDKDGQITIDGFYDKVTPLTDEERQAFKELNFDEVKLQKDLELSSLYGEKGYTFLEQTTARPTLEINGIYGGFQGEGTKTVLPSEAGAKITCRLVGEQDPDEIWELIENHVDKHTPTGVTVKVTRFDKGNPYVTPFDHPVIQAAARAYEKGYGVPPVYTRGGGSIPIVEAFGRILAAPVVLMGFGLNEENIHAPNEHFHLENFDKGLITLYQYWYELKDLEI